MRGYSRLVSSHATSYYRLLSPNGVLAHAGNMYAAMPTYHLVPTYHLTSSNVAAPPDPPAIVAGAAREPLDSHQSFSR